MIRNILFTFLIISLTLIIGCIHNIKEEYDVAINLEILKKYSKYNTINDKTLKESTPLTYNIINNSVYTERVNLTDYYGAICLKSLTDLGVKKYIEYLLHKRGSAEEELSFLFAQIFFGKPLIVLKEISKFNEDVKNEMLDHIVWGFLNNTYPSDPADRYQRLNGIGPLPLIFMLDEIKL